MSEELDGIFDPEPLHPDLEAYLFPMGALGLALQHPLVYSVPYAPVTNKFLNGQYEQKKRVIAEALAQGNWLRYVVMHERPWRVNALEDISDQMEPIPYWRLVAHLWTDSENIHQNKAKWNRFLTDPRPGRANLMNEDDLAVFEAMTDPIVVFRGACTTSGLDGVSWTLDEKIAQRLANRQCRNFGRRTYLVARGLTERKHVIAYLDIRNEREVLVPANRVHGITKTRYDYDRNLRAAVEIL